MKIRLLVSRAGVGFSQNRGDIIDVSDAEAKRMLDRGQAEAVEAEKATAAPPATRKPVKRKRKPKGTK